MLGRYVHRFLSENALTTLVKARSIASLILLEMLVLIKFDDLPLSLIRIRCGSFLLLGLLFL
jgi:FlaA1/EpsC-like NDP-sugar epimerase